MKINSLENLDKQSPVLIDRPAYCMCRIADAPLYFIEKSRKKHGILYCTHFVLCRTIKESFKNFILHYITSKSFDSQNFSTCDISCYLILRQIGPPSVSSSAFNDILAKWCELSSPSQFLHYFFIWFFLKTISAQFTSPQSKNLFTKPI